MKIKKKTFKYQFLESFYMDWYSLFSQLNYKQYATFLAIRLMFLGNKVFNFNLGGIIYKQHKKKSPSQTLKFKLFISKTILYYQVPTKYPLIYFRRR